MFRTVIAWFVSLAFAALAALAIAALVQRVSLVSGWAMLIATILGFAITNPLVSSALKIRKWRMGRVVAAPILFVTSAGLILPLMDESDSKDLQEGIGMTTDEYNQAVESHNKAVAMLKTQPESVLAISLLENNCAVGLPISCYSLGRVSVEKKKFEQAKFYYNKGCRSRHDPVIINSALSFSEPRDIYDDERLTSCYNAGSVAAELNEPEQAIAYFKELCAKDWPTKVAACSRLGSLYVSREGSDVIAKGIELLTYACDRADPEACHNLAMRYMAGAGVPYDPGKAEKLASIACEQGTENKKKSCDLVKMVRSYR